MRNILVLLISSLFCNLIKANVWDDVFTNYKSPKYVLPFSGTMKLKKQVKEVDKEIITYRNITLFDIQYSILHNSIRIDYLNSIKNDVVINVNTTLLFALYENKLYTRTPFKPCTISSPFGETGSFINILFLLRAYDTFSFFNETDTNWYEYYITKLYMKGNSNKDNELNEFHELNSSDESNHGQDFLEFITNILEEVNNASESEVEDNNKVATNNKDNLDNDNHEIRFLEDRSFGNEIFYKKKKIAKDDSKFTFYVNKDNNGIDFVDIHYSTLSYDKLYSIFKTSYSPSKFIIWKECLEKEN